MSAGVSVSVSVGTSELLSLSVSVSESVGVILGVIVSAGVILGVSGSLIAGGRGLRLRVEV